MLRRNCALHWPSWGRDKLPPYVPRFRPYSCSFSFSSRASIVCLKRAKGCAPESELLSKVVDGASGGDLILPDSVDEFHIFNDLSQAAVAW